MIHADDTDRFASVRARNTLVRSLREALKGRGLNIRERRKELVISVPRHPERGRVYITLASGEVSHVRTIWIYLGHLPRHATDHDLDDEPQVDTNMIAAMLAGPDAAACPRPGGCLQVSPGPADPLAAGRPPHGRLRGWGSG